MNFKPYLLDKIKQGTKTQTRRIPKWNQHFNPLTNRVYSFINGHSRLKWKTGGFYSACPGRGKPSECCIVITDIRTEKLSIISREDAIREGFATVEEFLTAWDLINGVGKRDIEVVVLTFMLRENYLAQQRVIKHFVAHQESLFQ